VFEGAWICHVCGHQKDLIYEKGFQVEKACGYEKWSSFGQNWGSFPEEDKELCISQRAKSLKVHTEESLGRNCGLEAIRGKTVDEEIKMPPSTDCQSYRHKTDKYEW
jgi:hypothetical protein